MAQNFSYGIGQYTYDESFEYTTQLGEIEYNNDSSFVKYVDHEDNSGLTYRDIAVSLKTAEEEIEITADETYLMTIVLPCDPQFDNTINLKLCAEFNQEIDFNNFQQIKQINIPHDANGENYSVPVALFQYNITPTVPQVEAGVIHLFTEDKPNNIEINKLYKHDNNYKYASQGGEVTKWADLTGFTPENIIEYTLLKTWSNASSTKTFSISFIFSPKYDLVNPYKYLLLEMVRNNIDQNMIKASSNQTYTGRVLPLDNIKVTISKINNLISTSTYGLAPIKSGTNGLCQIDVQASKGQKLSINGEEIVIGVKETYSLKDFNITSLGIIPLERPKEENSEDQEENSEDQKEYCDFIIDYKYAIEN